MSLLAVSGSSSILRASEPQVRRVGRLLVRRETPSLPFMLEEGGTVVTYVPFSSSFKGRSALDGRMRDIASHREEWADEDQGEVATTDRALTVGRQIVDAFATSSAIAIFPTSEGGLRFQHVDGPVMRAVEVGAYSGINLLLAEGPSYEEHAWAVDTVAVAAGFLREHVHEEYVS